MAPQPTCSNEKCNHPLTFHGGKALRLSPNSYQLRQKPCRALGCECQAFDGIDPGIPEWAYAGIDVAQFASANGLAEGTVRKSAIKFGGIKVDGNWLFPSLSMPASS